MLKDVLWQLNSCARRIIPRKTIATRVVHWRSRCRRVSGWSLLCVMCGLHSFRRIWIIFFAVFKFNCLHNPPTAFFCLKAILEHKTRLPISVFDFSKCHFCVFFTNNLLKIKFVRRESVNNAAFGQFSRRACTRFVPASLWCKQYDCDLHCCRCFVVPD